MQHKYFFLLAEHLSKASSLHQHQSVKMVSPSWFEAVSSPDNEDCHPHSAQALKAFHEGKTTTHEAASAITHPIATSPSNHLDVERNGLWSLLISALMDWPRSETPALLQLLKAIQQVPDPAISEEAKLSVGNGPFWDGLPGFGHMWADDFERRTMLRLCAGQNGHENNNRGALREKYVHVARLEATFCDQQIGGINLKWGYERITDALERSDAIWDIEVLMAAEWLRILPHHIYKGALEQEEGWPLKRDLDLWTGDVMTVERWQWWKDRLEEYVREGFPGADSVRVTVQSMDAVTL